ncbi:piggyBac transposable element-derived protein 3-like [Homalodisca vitripennis]|uniref:piggyBac transposable element-derived protein 3-like n=1 Tax=Homalodisca vitripennis TaxID=197043 RepID=UPI001EEA375F|nr:piggyBac transposable element-derived protein 3-like [Homalodisca vitripennis]
MKEGHLKATLTSHNIAAVTWKDNSVVTLLSKEHGVAPLGEAKRYSVTERKKVSIPQPYRIAQYNRNMGGVDLMDNNISNYRIGVRGKRWYIPIVLWLFDVVMSNTWFLARSQGVTLDSLFPKKCGPGFYFKNLDALLKQTGPTRALKRASNPLRSDHGGYLIVKGQSRRRCILCKNKTVKACKRCEVPLHDTCFADFHKE